MSATPIPRTLIMSVYGDMDISIIKEKPNHRKEIITYSKLENKIDDVIRFIKKELNNKNQVFWVCPLIDESEKLDHQSAIKKFDYLNKIFPGKVALMHGKIDKDKKSMSFRIKFQSTKRTLKDEEVDVVINKIVDKLKNKFDAIQR